MDLRKEMEDSLERARFYVTEGVEQILTGRTDEAHSISASPGATALAALALLILGRGFESSQRRGVQWLKRQYQGGWGKYPGAQADEEMTKIVTMVLQGSNGGWKAKLRLLTQARYFSALVLSLGQAAVPGLEGPTKEETFLPKLLEEGIITKLPSYGRPVIVAASLMVSKSPAGIRRGVEYLLNTQMPDGSWSEDVISTSLAVLGLAMRSKGEYVEQTGRAGAWLVRNQYSSGGWPAFDQLQTWAMAWAVCVFGERAPKASDVPWLEQGAVWLKKGQNADGSFGSTPPFSHPDLDDTAVALIGLHQALGEENRLGTNLLKRLQNPDGSWGTFPSFQGRPPQISSQFPVYMPSVDVSVHVLEALWRRSRSQDACIWRGLTWLLAQQKEDGSFPASWYEGPVYSTAQVLELLSKWKFSWRSWNIALQILGARTKAQEFLLNSQKTDGGWGSVGETGLALGALWRYEKMLPGDVLAKGASYLLQKQRSNGSYEPSYQGIYAKAWNYEEPLSSALTSIRALQRYLCL